MPAGFYPRPSPEERLWAKVRKQPGPNGCWLWLGAHNGRLYGTIFVDNRVTYVHRLSYELAKGPIPDGLQIDHLCRVHNCVNPKHLEAVTSRQNILRGNGPRLTSERWRAITHCKRGHAYAENTMIVQGKKRVCRVCHYWRTREWYRRERARRSGLSDKSKSS
ncbi:hypothetical protein CMI37_20450 [Candidatus Pacearchaeota archaeon]|nr:hypothetical protein [Candidatus Pacearchaeota archaeon]